MNRSRCISALVAACLLVMACPAAHAQWKRGSIEWDEANSYIRGDGTRHDRYFLEVGAISSTPEGGPGDVDEIAIDGIQKFYFDGPPPASETFKTNIELYAWALTTIQTNGGTYAESLASFTTYVAGVYALNGEGKEDRTPDPNEFEDPIILTVIVRPGEMQDRELASFYAISGIHVGSMGGSSAAANSLSRVNFSEPY